MDILRRSSAQLSDAVWKELDEAAATAARNVMTARRIATFDGPRGWDYIAAPLGTMKACATREGKAVVCVPEIALLAQIRADFSLSWAAVEAFERGGPALDTATAEAAAREVALAEDRLAYSGEPVGTGFLEDPASPRMPLGDWSDPSRVIADLVGAVELLDRQTVPGPYEAVLSADRYYAYLAAANLGYPVTRHTKSIIADVHRSLVMHDGGALFSMRGGDFILTVGGDLAVGYRSHDRDSLHLFCVETLAPQTLDPGAVCVLGKPARRLIDADSEPRQGVRPATE